MTLQLEAITKVVGRETHLYPIDLTLNPGAVYMLLGPTLAGKTSLMRVMAGLDRPTTGKVVMDGRDVTGLSVRKRSVAMVYQQFINYPASTVYDNIASPLRRAGQARATIDEKVRAAAATLRIEALLDRLPSELSGGQQQRTALARALVKDCDLLLLDEPLVNLDYKLREGLRAELQAIFREGRSTVIYATTEPLEALAMGGNTIVLDAGRVMQTGPTVQVYHHPADLRVGQVFSDPPMNMIETRVEGGTARLGESLTIPLRDHLNGLSAGRFRFGVRANHLSVVRASAADTEFEATVDLAEINGSETFIHASHSGISWVVQEEGVHSLGLGESIRVYFDPGNLFAFDENGRLVAAPRRGAAALAAQ